MTKFLAFFIALIVSLTFSGNAFALLDNTPPVIVPTVTGTLGNNGWYTSNVQVTWSVTDAQSSISNKTNCGTTNVNNDTTGQTITCTATSGGGTSSNSVTIKRDATKPVITAAQNPLPNSFGWNNTDVTIHFSCTDSTSGPAIGSPTSDITKTAEGAGQGYTGTCIDNAGNTKSVNGVVNIDKTNPGIVGSRNTLPNTNGWNNTNVSVHFACSDSLSGPVDSGFNVSVNTEGANQSANGTCNDKAGNSASTSVTNINIDKTNPGISSTRSPAPNGFGWNKTDVTAHFTCTDSLSGVATSPNPFDIVVSSEGAGQSATGTCTDLAGNTKSKTVSNINIDKTNPNITLNMPTNGIHFVRFDNVNANWSVSDSLSGINTSSGTVASGSLIDTTVAGSFPFVVNATDKAGNSANVNVTYIVDPYPAECAGIAPFAHTIIGTNGDDSLNGLPGGSNLIFGRDGDNEINAGSGGGNCIVGGDGNETLNGGTGNDIILGGKGDDIISGGAGDDQLYGGPGNDTIDGGTGNDQIFGGDGDDSLAGGSGDDFIDGGLGIDTINGGSGTDTCIAETKLACEL